MTLRFYLHNSKYKYLSQLTSPSQPHRASYLHHHFLYARVVTSLRSCLNIPNITVAGGRWAAA